MAQEGQHRHAQTKKPSCERQPQLYPSPGGEVRRDAGVGALGLAGAGLLVWWAVAFHPADEQLWMVPSGPVMLGTPVVAWLSIFTSGASRRLRGAVALSEPQPQPLPVDAGVPRDDP